MPQTARRAQLPILMATHIVVHVELAHVLVPHHLPLALEHVDVVPLIRTTLRIAICAMAIPVFPRSHPVSATLRLQHHPLDRITSHQPVPCLLLDLFHQLRLPSVLNVPANLLPHVPAPVVSLFNPPPRNHHLRHHRPAVRAQVPVPRFQVCNALTFRPAAACRRQTAARPVMMSL
jgi:hypothetical protein